MKINKVIIPLLVISIATLIFYFYRLSVEIKSKKVALFLEYNAFTDYVNNENKQIQDFIKELKSLQIQNILIYPSRISDLLNEYNEILLLKGMYLKALHNNNVFNSSSTYLLIPKPFDKVILGRLQHDREFDYKNNRVYEFHQPFSFVLRMKIEYRHFYENILQDNHFTVMRTKNEPGLKNIDEFFILNEKMFSDSFLKNQSVIKIHQVKKKFYREEDSSVFIDEHIRAVKERNVQGIIIPSISYDTQLYPLQTLIGGLKDKLRGQGYFLTSMTNLNVRMNDKIILIYRWIIILSVLIILFILFKKYLLIFSGGALLFLMVDIHLFYILILFCTFYLFHDYLLGRNDKMNVPVIINIFLFPFLTGILVSNFLFDNQTRINALLIPGVKLIYLLPLIMFSIQYVIYKKIKMRKLLKQKINLLNLGTFLLLGALFALIIFRSGNLFASLNSLELTLRDFLEKIFFLRPRFKEIFFYQFIIYFYVYRKNGFIKDNNIIFYLLIVMSISSTLNSFLHIHTLSYYTMLRSMIGMGLSVIFAFIIIIISRIKVYGS